MGSLGARIRLLAVERAEILRLDEIETGPGDPAEQLGDLGVRNRGASRLGEEAAAPVIAQEGLWKSSRPHVDAAVADRRERQPVSGERGQLLAEVAGRSRLPVEEDVDA